MDQHPSRQSAAGVPRPVLSVGELAISFGGIAALSGVTFSVGEGEILGVIGPNGAGKTTLFNCISGVYRPNSGTIRLGEVTLNTLPPHRRARLGITRTFQNLALFDSLSVFDNIRAGADFRGPRPEAPGQQAGRRGVVDIARGLIDELGLGGVAGRHVGGLPMGTRKRVELARALAGAPRLLLLDEPAAGLLADEAAEIGDLIRRVRLRHRLTVLLVEHQMPLIMALSDRIMVLDFGRKIAEGTPAEVRNDPAVLRAYLGTAA